MSVIDGFTRLYKGSNTDTGGGEEEDKDNVTAGDWRLGRESSLWLFSLVRPLLDNGLKGGNSEIPERASICNHFGVRLSVFMFVCDQATGHSFRPSKLIF